MDTNQTLSPAFVEFASHLDPMEREALSLKRSESIQESFRNRPAQLDRRSE